MSKKTEVVEILFDQIWPEGNDGPLVSPMLVSNQAVQAAIVERNARHPGETKGLSAKNPANFLKDMIRKTTCNAHWPQKLKDKRITARQRYGESLVFEFFSYRNGDTVPFPDRFDPDENVRNIEIETISLPRAARALGRIDEPWLTQVVVYQRIVHSHLAIVSPLDVIDLSHLQMSVKTQPEIDGLFVTSIKRADHSEIRALLTMEAKQRGERILEDQIREQVQKAFEMTRELQPPNSIQAVLPMVVKVVDYPEGLGSQRGIYICEFELVERITFDSTYAEALHDMPLRKVSSAFYLLCPPVSGISAPVSPAVQASTNIAGDDEDED